MKITVHAHNFRDDENFPCEINTVSLCPHCGATFGGYTVDAFCFPYPCNYPLSLLLAVHFCAACEKPFVSLYRLNDVLFNIPAEFLKTWPNPTPQIVISTELQKISPAFTEIYEQAALAEAAGLSEICGMGYRKALEFLIKDFAIHMEPDKEEQIKKASLSQVIANHISERKIKILAERSAWLGNDETHYVRKHQDYSLSDLKAFLAATQAFIEYALTVQKAEQMTAQKQLLG